MGEQNLHGKTCVITGASVGIGRATAAALAARGAAVVIVCRDRSRGEAARAQAAAAGGPPPDLVLADLATAGAVREAARAVLARHPRVDVLVNNAGATFGRRTLTPDGVEATFAVNVLAPRLLTTLLLPALEAAAPARVVNVASGMLAPPDLGDLNRDRGYRQMAVYAESKMALAQLTREYARRLAGTGVTANAMTPGMVRTDLGRETRGTLRLFLTAMRPFMKSPARAAEYLVHLAAAPGLERTTGMYFVGTRPEPDKVPSDDDATGRLWDVVERMSGSTAN